VITNVKSAQKQQQLPSATEMTVLRKLNCVPSRGGAGSFV